MLSRILGRSLSIRKSRVAFAVIAAMMGASIAGALVTVSMNVNEKVGMEFREYGANILLVPRSDSISISIGNVDYGSINDQKFIEESDLPKIKEINWSANVYGYAPYLYSIVTLESQNIVLSGIWFDQVKKISPWWDVTGDWITDRNDTSNAIIGVSVAEVLDLEIGDTVSLLYSDSAITAIREHNIVGIVSTGGSEDGQIFVTLRAAQEMTQRIGKVSTVQVSALCNGCPIETIAGEIEAEIPYVQAKSVQQVVHSEMEVLNKVEDLMLLVAFAALLASAFGVMSTMTASVLERTNEIGLMKAIGAEDRKIALLFLSEAIIIGLLGGLFGFIAGYGVAQFIGFSVFDSAVELKWLVLPLVIGLSVGVSLAASLLPVRRALRIEPAKVLRRV